MPAKKVRKTKSKTVTVTLEDWNNNWFPKLTLLPNPNKGHFLMVYQQFSGPFMLDGVKYHAVGWSPPGDKPYVEVTRL